MESLFRRVPFAFLVATAIGIAGCGGSGGGGNSSGTLRLQIVSASPDSPTLDFRLDGVQVTSLDFKESTARTAVAADAGVVLLTADTPDGPVNAFGPTALGLTRNLKTTLVALGKFASLSTLKIEVPDTAVPAGKTRVQLAHAAPVGAALDVYITVPFAPITGSTPVARLSFGQVGASVDLDAGLLQIRITERGQQIPIFDSGPFTLADGEDLLFLVIENTTTAIGSFPVSLMVLDDAGGSEVLDVTAPAEFRAAHASPITGPLDVRTTPSSPPTPVFTGLTRGNVAGFAPRVPNLYGVDFLFAGTLISAVDDDVNMDQGVQYTVYAANVPGALDFFVTEDERRRIATEARLQIVHLAPAVNDPSNIGPIDVYVVPTGEPILFAEPHLENLIYEDIRTDYRAFADDLYDLVITAADSKIEIAPRQALDMALLGVYSVVIRDDGFGIPEFSFMDDF